MRMGMDSYGRLRGGAVAPTLTTKGGAAVVEVFSVDGGKRPVPIPSETIQSRILGMRGIPVMLDRDLAELYGVPVKRLNEQVRRNIERFPEPFMFQLTAGEVADLKSQIATSSEGGSLGRLKSQIATSSWGGVRKPPKVFSEQGVAMLSAVLNSKTAVAVSIAIMDAFVKMRRFQVANREMLCRIDMLERRQLTTDAKIDEVLDRLNQGEVPSQGVFFNGQLWDARSLAEKLIGRAKKTILLIDNWIGPGTLDVLAKKRVGVVVDVVTSEHRDRRGTPRQSLAPSDIADFNAQYPSVVVRYNEHFHDRFLILDDKELYLIGASLKDLGKRCFAFTRLDSASIPDIKARI